MINMKFITICLMIASIAGAIDIISHMI